MWKLQGDCKSNAGSTSVSTALFASLKGGKEFTKLNSSIVYQQLRLYADLVL